MSNQNKRIASIGDMFNGLDWSGPGRVTHNGEGADITINRIAKGYSITIRRSNFPKRVVIAVKDNVVFFKKDDNGWTVSCHTEARKGKNGYIQIAKKTMPELENFVGNYNLHYFQPLDTWYMEKKEDN